jgi:hypothetical protein
VGVLRVFVERSERRGWRPTSVTRTGTCGRRPMCGAAVCGVGLNDLLTLLDTIKAR